ncbi:MAG TPA: EF-P lysine aminoacylase EpmA [Hyphomicrobiaceae bacterium]|nr:EF-P lysine aminoacylase EpmA [Hyphomicrobiaceae bacterium]
MSASLPAPSPPPLPWWHPDRHADRRPFLVARSRIKAALRAWFEAEGFVEVDTGCLQVSPGNETHLHAFKTELVGSDLGHQPLYLHTSPEFACKKLLAAGERKIFTFAPVFRNRERGRLHHPEFTMLEWYRADTGETDGGDYRQLWSDCAAILQIAATAAGSTHWSFRERSCDPFAPPIAVTLDNAFKAHAGIDLLNEAFHDGAGHDGVGDRERFARAAVGAGVKLAPDDTWSDIFTRVLVECVEPQLCPLGTTAGPPVIVHDYPIAEAALARPCPHDRRVAERFELYACGVELANGFGELNDPTEQRRRFEAAMDEKQRIYGERYPIDADFLAALEMMPRASGCALGFERLVMLAAGARHIDDVIWTPMARD